MLCEKYKPALIEAAVTGDELSPDVRAHVETCSNCAAELTQQRSLIAAIDTNLNRQMNSPVPALMLHRLEAHLAQQTALEPARSSRWRWLYATSALAAVAAVLFFVLPHRRGPNTTVSHESASQPASNIKQSPPTVTMVLQPATPEEIRRDRVQHTRLAARTEPEVIVPPDEQMALDSYIARGNARREFVVALNVPTHQGIEPPFKDLEIPNINTAEIVIQPIATESRR